MEKIWQIREAKYRDILSQILFNRGIVGENAKNSEIDEFINPDFDKGFHPSKQLPDYQKAIKRIKLAIDGKQKVGIYADYDADGIPGAALLYKMFSLFGITPEVYIPTREIGYGFNRAGLDYLISKGCKLIISVDLGIKEFELSEYVQKKGIDLIITDHHIADSKLPKSLAVINPKIPKSKYPFSELSGAGVVYKIAQGLAVEYPSIINENFLKWNLDIVAISTISDVVPLIDENRIIAKFGLKVLQKTRNIGLKAIYNKAGIDYKKIDSYTVGFQIGPRINAPGRIDHATASFETLITQDVKEADVLAEKLEKQNSHRQEMMKKILDDAQQKIVKDKLLKNKLIILADKDWSKGVIGPVSSNIAEKFHRPTILFCQEKDQFVGSARSISGFNIVEALEKVEDLTLSFGGHAGAAGVRVAVNKFKIFSQKLTELINNKIKDQDLLPKLTIDLELPKDKINVRVFKRISELAPFGLGNPKPVFITKNLALSSHRYVGKDSSHLQMQFSVGKSNVKGIMFSYTKDKNVIKDKGHYDIVYIPSLNFWNGKWWPDMQILDFKELESSE